MKHLSSSEKNVFVQKVLDQPQRKIKEIAAEANIGYSTLQKWIAAHRRGKLVAASTTVARSGSGDTRQLKAVLDCENQSDEYRNRYCRQQGIYPQQLLEWKDNLMKKNSNQAVTEQKSEIRILKEENKKLQKELKRKDKALAEVSALLILKKKAEIFFGKDDEDN